MNSRDQKTDGTSSSDTTMQLGKVRITQPILEHLMKHSHEAIMIVNEDYKIDYVNEVALNVLGRPAEGYIGHDFREFLASDVASRVSEKFSRRQKGDIGPGAYRIEVTRLGGDKATLDLIASVAPTDSQGKKTVLHILDITQQVTDRKALEQSEEKYRTLVETMNDGLSIDDEKGRIVYANNAFCDMLERDPEEIIGHGWIEFTKEKDSKFVESKREERKAGISDHYELKWETKSGKVVPTIVSAMPYFSPENEFLGTFAVVTDISSQKEAEESIQFYLDLLTHDIANQLQVIMTSSGLLDEELPDSYIDDARMDIQDAVERCNRLITKVKRAGQLRHLPTAKVNLTEVVEEKVSVVRRVHCAQVKVVGLQDKIIVHADALLGELIWNLLENAARHNPKDERKIWVEIRRLGDMVEIAIADNGPGISDSRKEALFDKSRRAGGVGLTLVSQMATKYGGKLEIFDRVPGQPSMGAKFVLTLRLAE
ncbi:PAS domain-containing sensor histidine kinase [Candidatus Thorarchaeota archaeon]|nr:MAG: PAS domain-containing sensor histidine kinase [Candidatus Thorarchaeota archaeon]